MSAERDQTLQILMDAEDLLLIRGLAYRYVGASQVTLEVLERQLAAEGKAYLVGERREQKRTLGGPAQYGHNM